MTNLMIKKKVEKMINDIARNYSEVYEILNLLGSKYIEKIPKKLYSFFEEERDLNYKKYSNLQEVENDSNIDENTLSIIAYLYIQYWCNNEDEKKELLKIYKNNDLMHEKELREKYNPDDIFKKCNNKKDNVDNIEENQANMIAYKESIFKRIINKIKMLFHFG